MYHKTPEHALKRKLEIFTLVQTECIQKKIFLDTKVFGQPYSSSSFKTGQGLK